MAVLEEDFALVELSVAVLVGENDHPVLVFVFKFRIGESLDHPDAAAIVKIECDRLHDVGFAREQIDAKSGRNRNSLESFLGRERFVGCVLGVGDSVGKSDGPRESYEGETDREENGELHLISM